MVQGSAYASLLLLLSTLAPAAVGGAPSPAAKAPRQDQTFFEAIDVDVVSVEVFVTDRSGNPVTDLKPEDFELTEDGQKVAVTNFYAEREAPPAAPAAAPAPGAAAPPAAQAAPKTPAIPDDQRLYLGVFIDNRSLAPGARNRALASMKDFLHNNLSPGDRVLLASYDGGLRIRRTPTEDRAALNDALAEMARGSSQGMEVRADLSRLLREIDQASPPPATEGGEPGGGGGGGGGFAVAKPDSSAQEADAVYAGARLFAQKRNDDVRATLSALREFVRSLAGLPGRKAVLFVSGGLPMRPAEAIYRVLERKYASAPRLNQSSYLEAFTYDATTDLRSMLAQANAHRVTFYSLAALDEISAAEQTSPLWTPDLASNYRFNEVGPLSDLAGATGGMAALDPVTPGPLLAQMHRDLATFYSLGYVSPDHKSGKTHKIAVKVNRPGLTVRHRENYVAETGIDRARDRTVSALLLGETKNPLGLAVDLGGQSRTKDGQIEVEVTVKFPLSNLVLLPSEHFHQGRVSVFIGSRDSHGRSSDVTQIAVPIRIANEQLLTAMGQSAGYQTKLLLRSEPHQVAVSIRDEIGNADSTVIAEFTPGAAAAPAVAPAKAGR